MEIQDLTIKKFSEGLVNKEFSAFEITKVFFDYIEKKDPSTDSGQGINAYLRLTKDLALSQANKVDIELAARNFEISKCPLAGVPLAIKDNILIEGELATAGSKILENYRASYDATVIRKLKEAGAVFLGKTNMDEFAMGSSTENSAFKITKNPYDLERVPGGSSGGSASAVASDMAIAALGSDTGGSIRQPAGFCGVVGLKPTYGAVSRYGLIAMASSLDQIGPITKTVEDAAILFEAIKGKDPLDSTSVKSRIQNSELRIKNLTIGLPKEYFIEGLDKDVGKAVDEAIERLKNLGIKFKEISLPHTKYALSCYYIIMPAEVSANLARFDGIRYSRINADDTQIDADSIRVNPCSNPRKSALRDIYLKTRGRGFGEEVKRRIILGTFVLSSGYYDAYYSKAQKVRRLIKEDFDKVFSPSADGVDVILTPVSPTPAFKIGEKTDDPIQMYLSDIFTIPVNLAGLPAISIPVNLKAKSSKLKANLPIGFQLIGKSFREVDILRIGQYYEKISE